MRDACSLMIGLDLGTSFSKVIVRNLLTEEAEAIEFPLPGGGHTALLPTMITAHKGRLFPVFGESTIGHLPYFKMLAKSFFRNNGERANIPGALLKLTRDRDRRIVIVDLFAWYFAQLLAGVEAAIPDTEVVGHRVWDEECSGDYVGVQVCVPAGDMRDKALLAAMHEALHIGYVLRGSVDPHMQQSYPVQDWFDACDQARQHVSNYKMSNFCFAYPEVAAGIQTLQQASTTRDGIYITMDVGAGTVDMNVVLKAQGNGRHPLNYLACEVAPLGVQRLQSHSSVDPYDALHQDGCHAEGFPLHLLGVEGMKAKLNKMIQKIIHGAQQQQPNLGNVDGLRTWDAPNVYVWGGGSAEPLYAQVLQDSLAKDLHLANVDVMKLPTAEDLRAPATVEFGRFAVGYGLSFHPANLAEVRLPSELPPLPRPPRPPWHPQFGGPGTPGYWTLDGTD